MRGNIQVALLERIKVKVYKGYYSVMDSLELILGRRDPLTPPNRLIYIGPGNFKQLGDSFLQLFVNLGDLQPDHRVLDVGCGVGRMARALTNYLDQKGVYEGFDIVSEGIEWCKRNITTRYPNYHFILADIHNDRYYPQGRNYASEYVYP